MKEVINTGEYRTEEVQHIIDRMPTKFGLIISFLVLFIISLITLFGWIVSYPDVITGSIRISSKQTSLNLVAPISGKLKFSELRSKDLVKEGEIIAWFDNASNPSDVLRLSNIIDSISLPTHNAWNLYTKLPKATKLGELTSQYFVLLNAIKQLADYQENLLYHKQAVALENLLLHQHTLLEASKKKVNINKENMELVDRFRMRDSLLLKDNVVSFADMDRTKISSVAAHDQYQNTLRDLASSEEQISITNSRLQELSIQMIEKEQQLHLDLLTAYNSFRDNLTSWKQKYIMIAPFDGHVQFLNFWTNDQYIRSGEPVFALIPKQSEVIGQIDLPTAGAGKVKTRQKVLIKLDDYPYLEYGIITGAVEDISLTTNRSQIQQNEIDTYLVTVSFPDQLKSNYGSMLEFKSHMKGTAEIVTKDRRLISRFFDNLKYALNK